MLKKHNRHGPWTWLLTAVFLLAGLLALPAARPVYADGDTGGGSVQTAYPGFSAVSDVKVNDVSVKKYGSYTVEFIAEGENITGTPMQSVEWQLDTTYTLPANTYQQTGYEFTGWNTKKDGSGTAYTDQQSVSNLGKSGDTVKLYAQWNADMFKITYDLDGGSFAEGVTPLESFNADRTEPYKLPTPTKQGYIFTGWQGDDWSRPYKDVSLDTPDWQCGHDIHLTAHWGQGVLHVTYNVRGNGVKYTAERNSTDTSVARWHSKNVFSPMNKKEHSDPTDTGTWWGAATSYPNGLDPSGNVTGRTTSTGGSSLYEEVWPITDYEAALPYMDQGFSAPGNPGWLDVAAPKGYHTEYLQEYYAIVDGQKKIFNDEYDYSAKDLLGSAYDPDNPKDYYVTLYINWLSTTGWMKPFSQQPDNWYYVDKDGSVAAKGWITDGSHWRYIDQDAGKMYDEYESAFGYCPYDLAAHRLLPFASYAVRNRWFLINSKWYYFDNDAYMVTGWYKYNDYWYYYTTALDHASWGDNYPEGSMLANTYLDQNGRRYNFDSNGHCTNPEGTVISSAKRRVMRAPAKNGASKKPVLKSNDIEAAEAKDKILKQESSKSTTFDSGISSGNDSAK